MSVWRRLRHLAALAIEPVRRPGRFSVHHYPREAALARIRQARPLSVLDVGCGGRRLGPVAVAIDLDRAARPDLVADGAALPVRDGSVDGVWLEAVLEHVPEPERVLAEARRVLVPGGWVYVEVPFLQGEHAAPADYRRWTRDGLRQLLGEFEVEWIEPAAGPFSVLAYQLRACLALLTGFGSDTAWRAGFEAVWGWLVWPLKWLDVPFRHHPRAQAHAFGWAVMARRRSPAAGSGPARP